MIKVYEKLLYNLKSVLPSRRLLFEASASGSKNPPVFIIGCYRSGTSLLRRIVDSHSRVACPPESKFIVSILRMHENQEAMEGLDSMGFGVDHVRMKTREYIDYYFSNYARAKGKDRWADKTPDHVEHLDTLRDLFAGTARFVFIYRNGLDVAASLAERRFAAPNAYIQANQVADRFVGCASFWADQVRKMRQSRLATAGEALEIRYEDLVTKPHDIVKGLCAFIGVDYEPAMIDYHAFPHDKGIEDGVVTIRKGIQPSIGNYRDVQDASLSAAIREIGPVMRLIGYDVPASRP